MSDDLDRLFRLLVHTMTSRSPERLTQAFEVGALYQDILPYRLFRRELGLDTNQDYEMALVALLSGERGYLEVDERMADALRRELASPNPDSGVFKQFATARVRISREALARVAQPPAAGQGGGEDMETSRASSGPPAATGSPAAPVTTITGSGRTPITPAAGESCRFCGGKLPAGRPITYCPHCGQDQTVLHCDACGTELDVGWKFCTTCGRGVTAGAQ